MSNIYNNSYYTEEQMNIDFNSMQAEEQVMPSHAALVAAINYQVGATAGGMAGMFPEDPNDPDFDVNIQDYYNAQTGQYDIVKFMDQAVRLPLYYLYAEDPTNPNASVDALEALTQVAGVWQNLTTDQKSYVTNFLGTPLSNAGGSVDFINNAVNILAGMEYFFGSPPAGMTREEFTVQFLNQVSAELAPIAGVNSWTQELFNTTNNLAGNFDSWMQKYSALSSDQFEFATSLNMEEIVLNSDTMTTFFNNARHMQVVNAEQVGGSNVFLVYIMLIAILFGENDDMQMQESGGAKMLNVLTDRTNDANQALNLWNAGGSGTMTAQQAQQLAQILQQSSISWQDGRLAQSYPTINSALSQFLDPNNSVTLPVASGPYPAGTPIGQIIADVSPGGKYAGQYNLLAGAFNACQYDPATPPTNPSDPTPPPTIPSAKNTLTLALQQIQTTASQQSSTITQQMQTVEGTTEKAQTMLSSALSVWIDTAKAIVQNMQSSGS